VAQHCGAGLTVTALTGEGHAAARRAAVSAAGQLVVATPGRVAQVCCANPQCHQDLCSLRPLLYS